MRNRFKKFLVYPYEDETRNAVEQELGDTAYRTCHITAVVIILFEAFMIAVTLLQGLDFKTDARKLAYLTLYTALLLITVLFYLAAVLLHRRKGMKAGRQFLAMQVFYGLILCLWGCAVTYLDLYEGDSLIVFSYVTLAAAALIRMRPWQGLLLFGANFVMISWVSERQIPDPELLFSTFINLLFLSVLAMVVSVYLYRLQVSSLRDKLTVDRQNAEIRRLNETLHLLSVTDELTGLNNRRFFEHLSEMPIWKNAASISGMMVDIDHFKQYNDTFGHLAGDDCLRSLAKVLIAFASQSGAYVVRYGGEEFFLVLFDCGREKAFQTAQALKEAIAQRNLKRNDLAGGRVTVSIGVHTCRNENGSLPAKELVAGADSALYEAKRSGRDKVVSNG